MSRLHRTVRLILICLLSLIVIFIYKDERFIRSTSEKTRKNDVAALSSVLSNSTEHLPPFLKRRFGNKTRDDRNNSPKDLVHLHTLLDEKNTQLQNASISKNGTVSDGDDEDTMVKNRFFWKENMNGQNVYNYVYSNRDLCTRNHSERNESVFLLIMCLTAPSETKRREYIRNTWANVTYVLGKRVATVFLLANTTSDKLNEKIDEENRLFKDICMKDFIDSYENLTLKTMMGFRWINSFCNQTKFVLKIDSDIVPNLRNLIRHLDKQTEKTTYRGHLLTNAKPIRPNSSGPKKWMILKSAYPHPMYPPYVQGYTYLVSGNLVNKLVSVSDHIPYIFEDVYVGMLMKTIGVKPTHDHRYTQKIFTNFENTIVDSLCIFNRVFTVFHLHVDAMYKFWSLWTHFDTNECQNSTGVLSYH